MLLISFIALRDLSRALWATLNDFNFIVYATIALGLTVGGMLDGWISFLAFFPSAVLLARICEDAGHWRAFTSEMRRIPEMEEEPDVIRN